MTTPMFPNARLLDVYMALEFGGALDMGALDDQIQDEGVNATIRDYDFFHSAPGVGGGEEYVIARPRTGKGVQFAVCTDMPDEWVPNGQWDPAQQMMVDPSAPVPGVNAPVAPPGGLQVTQGGVPLGPGVYAVGPGGMAPIPIPGGPATHGAVSVRMTQTKQLQVDPEVVQKIGTGPKGDKMFGDALDQMLADAEK